MIVCRNGPNWRLDRISKLAAGRHMVSGRDCESHPRNQRSRSRPQDVLQSAPLQVSEHRRLLDFEKHLHRFVEMTR